MEGFYLDNKFLGFFFTSSEEGDPDKSLKMVNFPLYFYLYCAKFNSVIKNFAFSF